MALMEEQNVKVDEDDTTLVYRNILVHLKNRYFALNRL